MNAGAILHAPTSARTAAGPVEDTHVRKVVHKDVCELELEGAPLRVPRGGITKQGMPAQHFLMPHIRERHQPSGAGIGCDYSLIC